MLGESGVLHERWCGQGGGEQIKKADIGQIAVVDILCFSSHWTVSN